MSTVALRDDQWVKILPFLRSCPHVYVGQEAQCRRFVEGILWIARSGAQWRLLPEKYGSWTSIYKRFARWCDHGVWERRQQHCADDPDREQLLLDSPIIRAHPCAAGAAKNRWTSRLGLGAQSGWVPYHNPRACRWFGQPLPLSAHWWAMPRHHPRSGFDYRVRQCRCDRRPRG